MRRVVMWIAVVSLAGLAVFSAVPMLISLASSGTSGWTFYSPYSRNASPGWMQVMVLCGSVYRLLFPVAATSSAMYIYLVERSIMRQISSRGFEVQPVRDRP